MVNLKELYSYSQSIYPCVPYMRTLPCWANIKNPRASGPSGTSRCFSSIHPKSAIRWPIIRSRSRSSVVIGRGGSASASCGVNVLENHEHKHSLDLHWTSDGYAQIIKPIHHQLLHPLHGIIKLSIRRISPHFTFTHTSRDELQPSVQSRDLKGSASKRVKERTLRKSLMSLT